MPAIILCIDMDAFFASVEQQANPRLRGKPVAVIGSGGRTVITTRSYEARRYGVKTGMNIYEARRLCPHLVFVTGDNEKYTHTCRALRKLYLEFTPDVEVYSIDEAFLDITASHHLFGGPETIGSCIKRRIQDLFGINGTVGIGPNILIAKLASDMAKPDGMQWIKPEDVDSTLAELPVSELWGIGHRTAEKLALLGIRTCGELGNAPASLLRSTFGIIGESLHAMGRGRCTRRLILREEDPKSIGHSMTFPQDLCDSIQIEAQILKLSEMVGTRARKYGFAGRKVMVTVRYPDFETFSRQAALHDLTNHTHEIYHAARSILGSLRLRAPVRLLGVCLSGLERENGQMHLFAEFSKKKALLRAMDTVNDRHGDFKLTWGSCLAHRDPPRVISPAWRPSGVKQIHIKK
jgi:DNA polymerase-4